jgi:DNA-binding transcriptional LysR family regulator
MGHISQTEIRKLDFTLLLVMRGLLRHRRTTIVAAELGLSQSAISYALSRLRAVFRDKLFVRRPHGLAPTRHALELGPRIDALLRQAEEAIGLVEQFDAARTTRAFRIAALDYLATLLAPRLLGAFERAAPGARFATRVLRGADALESLQRDEVDLALGQFPRPLDGFVVQPLFTDDYCLVARADHRRIRGKVGKRLFEELKHVVISVDGDFRSLTDHAIQDLGLTRRVVATAPTFSTAFAMVGQSDAVSVAPRCLASAHAAQYGLAVFDLAEPLPPIGLFAVRLEGRDEGADWLARLVGDCVRPGTKAG